MVKSRMSVLDLRVQVRELNRRLCGSRVSNVYDVDERKYLLKLSVPPRLTQGEVGKSGDVKEGDADAEDRKVREAWKKVVLLVESGSRIHTTLFEREKGDVPSGFTLKLRKHIRTKRLNAIRQFGSDRAIDLEFTSSTETAHLIIEFYAGGNVILTDGDFNIIALLRMVRPKGTDTFTPRIVGAVYSAARSDNSIAVSEGKIQTALQESRPEKEARKELASKISSGPQFLEHALLEAGLKPSATIKVSSNRDFSFHLRLRLHWQPPFLPISKSCVGVDVTSFLHSPYQSGASHSKQCDGESRCISAPTRCTLGWT